jgi:hypothetical protein
MLNPATSNPTDYVAQFATFTADIDLTAQDTLHQRPADRLVLVNNTAGALSVALTSASGTEYEISVGANSVWIEDHKVSEIRAETADTVTQVRAYWYA